MIKKLLAGTAGVAATFALAALPAQAVPVSSACADSAGNYDWSISNPARYQAGPHEAVVGLSEAVRTVTITANAGCLEVGDTWRVYNGYFSAEGTISATDAAANKDSDVVHVEVPSSNSVAGDSIPVKLKVNDEGSAAGSGYEIDQSSADHDLVLLRRALFKYKTQDNRINFAEPYDANQPIRSGGALIRASWSSHTYVGYEGRNVHIQWRADTAAATYDDVQEVTTGTGGAVRSSVVVANPGGPTPGETIILRAKYFGNGTTSGNWSTGDRVAPA